MKLFRLEVKFSIQVIKLFFVTLIRNCQSVAIEFLLLRLLEREQRDFISGTNVKYRIIKSVGTLPLSFIHFKLKTYSKEVFMGDMFGKHKKSCLFSRGRRNMKFIIASAPRIDIFVARAFMRVEKRDLYVNVPFKFHQI